MALKFGFYNSVNGDRRYDSRQLSEIFNGIINDGVFASVGDGFIVSAGTGMNVRVGSGRAWFYGTWTSNDSDIIIPIDEPSITLNRIDVIVLEVNNSDSVRANSIKVIKGVPHTEPVAPVLTNTTFIKQIPLCHIYVQGGSNSIINANITNKIGTSECPFVTGILETLDMDNLLLQWDSEYNVWLDKYKDLLANWEINRQTWQNDIQTAFNQFQGSFTYWFDSIQDILDENAAGNLLQLIGFVENLLTVKKNNLVSAINEIIATNFEDWFYRKGQTRKTKFLPNGDILKEIRITATDELLVSLLTIFKPDGNIDYVLTLVEGNVVVNKTTIFETNGDITEVIS